MMDEIENDATRARWEPQPYVEAADCPKCGAGRFQPCRGTPTMHQERIDRTLAVQPTWDELWHENYRLCRVAGEAQNEADTLRSALLGIREEHADIPALVAFINKTLGIRR